MNVLYIIITILFCQLLIFGISFFIIKHNKSKETCSVITCSDVYHRFDLNKMNKCEKYEQLKKDYYRFRHLNKSCCKAHDESHVAEYRYINEFGNVKTIGYITKEKLVFEGKEYIFDKEEK